MKYADEKENITTLETTDKLTLPYTELLRYIKILKNAENSTEYSKEKSKVQIIQAMLDSFVVLEKLYLSGEYTQEQAIDEILIKLTLETLITAKIFEIDTTTSVEHNMQKITEHNELTEQLTNITPETLNHILPSLPDEQIELISKQIRQYNQNNQARKFIETYKEKQKNN